MIVDGIDFMHEALADSKKRIIAEGANATMLDIDFGTYPYVTSSSTGIGGVFTGLGVPPQAVETTIGIMKAYTTRVGAGPFPTWLDNEIGDRIQETG
jgi:adenylosuccinate synthase